MAMTTPTAEEMGTRWAIRAWMGLEWEAPTSWAWMEMGLALLEEVGVGQLLEAGVEEGEPEEEAEGHEHPAGGNRAVGPGDRPHAHRRPGGSTHRNSLMSGHVTG